MRCERPPRFGKRDVRADLRPGGDAPGAGVIERRHAKPCAQEMLGHPEFVPIDHVVFAGLRFDGPPEVGGRDPWVTKGGREVEERAVDAVVGSDELVKRSRISQCFNACALAAEVVSRVFPTDKGIDEMVRL